MGPDRNVGVRGKAGTRRAGARRQAAVILEIPSRTEFLALVRDVTRRMSDVAGFDSGLAERLALAVDEATTNVLEHAYAGATDRVVELGFEDRGTEFRVEIADHGSSVDPERLPRVDLKRYVRERRTGGLGVHLMGRIMDSVAYRRSRGRNVCCLVKRKAPQGRR